MSNWWAQRLSNPAAPPRQYQPPPQPRSQPTPPPPPPPVEEERCPACYSQNYMSAPGSKYKRCYDCGYPITQSGSGVGSTSSDTSAKPSVQVEGGGFNPTQIVGKVE